MSTTIPIYDATGQQVDALAIDDDIEHVNGRVSRGRDCYYKGVGVPYHSHWTDRPGPDEEVLATSGVFYMPLLVRKPALLGLTGIFQFQYQPQFTDFVGTCGVKELSIIENSEEFARSSVDIIKAVNYDPVNGQYYFKLNYTCGRRGYLNDGSPFALMELIEYMVTEDWNFIWDKRSINDITHDGRVSDVADIFRSNLLENKVGTVYSILYSLGNSNPAAYNRLCRLMGLHHEDVSSYVHNAVRLLDRCGIDVNPLYVSPDPYTNYKHIVMNYLAVGRNCGHCCYPEKGETIKRQYILKFKRDFAFST